MHTVALSSQPSEESYSIQKITHRQRHCEWQGVTKAGGVREYIPVNAVLARTMIVCSWRTTQDPLSFPFTPNASMHVSFWHSADCRHAHTGEHVSSLAYTEEIKPSWIQLLPPILPPPLLLLLLVVHTRRQVCVRAKLKAWLAWLVMGRNRLWLLIGAWRWICVCVLMRVRTEDWD